MKVIIHKNRHWPGVITRLWQFGFNNKPTTSFDITFNESARYILPEDDRYDVNKIFGTGYFNGFHHKDSARFGWNYNTTTNTVSLYAYCYVNGDRIIKPICDVPVSQRVRLIINITMANRYSFSVYDGTNNWHEIGTTYIEFTHNKKWRYNLGSYFGGNHKAPHNISYKLERK